MATCFFIDTAHNILDYVETIWKILKPGGVWINLGESLQDGRFNRVTAKTISPHKPHKFEIRFETFLEQSTTVLSDDVYALLFE